MLTAEILVGLINRDDCILDSSAALRFLDFVLWKVFWIIF